MTRSTKAWLLVVATGAVLTLAAGCTDSTGESTPDPLRQRVIDMGFSPRMIQDRGDHFVVEGDIIIWKRDLQGPEGGPAAPSGPRPEYQWRTTNQVGITESQSMKVSISSSLSAGWQAATRSAMTEWNSIPGVRVHFVEGTPADITVSPSSSLGDGVIAQSSFPANHKPGPTLYVSTNTTFESFDASQKLFVMAHEFGHSIGFRHTNWQTNDCYPPGWPHCTAGSDGAILVGHTPQTDTGSVMNGSSGGRFWTGFDMFDIEAALVLYPVIPAIHTNDQVPGSRMVVTWTPNAAALKYIVDWTWVTQCENPDGVIVPCGEGMSFYANDTLWSPGYPWTESNGCDAWVRIWLVFPRDTIIGTDPFSMPACEHTTIVP